MDTPGFSGSKPGRLFNRLCLLPETAINLLKNVTSFNYWIFIRLLIFPTDKLLTILTYTCICQLVPLNNF